MIQATRAVMPQPYQVTFEQFELDAPGPGQVLIETEASAISPGTELAIYTGIHQWLADATREGPKFPFVPGYSAVGRIIAIGDEVTKFAVGDRVVWGGRHASHARVDLTSLSVTIQRLAEHVPAPVAACAVLTRFPL